MARGFGISAIGEALYGDIVLLRAPILLPINTPVLFPAFGGRDADVSVTVSQRFGQRADLTAGKINLSTILNRSPLLGGGGVDTFMHVLAAAPVSGITPPYLAGAIRNVAGGSLRYTVMVYDPGTRSLVRCGITFSPKVWSRACPPCGRCRSRVCSALTRSALPTAPGGPPT